MRRRTLTPEIAWVEHASLVLLADADADADADAVVARRAVPQGTATPRFVASAKTPSRSTLHPSDLWG
ncbi:MAG: hypothetical protein ACKVPX_10565 [Myxococcaceae bacterium]